MMRWMVGILLVANLALLLWGQLIAPRDDAEKMIPPTDIGVIELINVSRKGETLEKPTESIANVEPVASASAQVPDEVVERPKNEVLEADPVVQKAVEKGPKLREPAVPPQSCGEAGPIGEEAEAIRLADLLRNNGLKVVSTSETTRRTAGFWVLVPAAVDTEAAKVKEAALKEAGVKDMWRFRKGELKDAISLGLYDREGSAAKRAAEVVTKGFNAEVRPNIKVSQTFALSYAGHRVEGLEALIEREVPGVPNKVVDCR
ncbi:MAG: hypothetical protein ACWA5Q_11800 [bacterium]